MKNPLLLQSFFSIIARFTGVGLNFLAAILITRSLHMNQAGHIFLLMTFITGIALLSRMGIEQLLVKEVASAGSGKGQFQTQFLKNCYRLTLFSSIIFIIIWFFVAPYIQTYFFKNEIELHKLRFAGIGILFFNILIINTFYLRAIKKTVISILSQNALSAITLLILMSVYLYADSFSQHQHYIDAYNWSLILAGFISLLITKKYLFQGGQQTAHSVIKETLHSLAEYKQLLRKALPLAPISFFSFLMLWADTLIVSVFLEPSQVALFNVAARVSFISLFFLGALDATIYPRLLDISRNHTQKLKSFFVSATLLVIVILLIVILLMALLAEPILNTFNEQYVQAQQTLTILLTAQFLRAISLTFSFMFIIREQVKYLNIILVIALIINLTSNVILINLYGIEGAAMATFISNGFLAFTVIVLFFIKRLLKSHNHA